MATFRIFEDQENRVNNVVGRKEKPAGNAAQKRTVLGVLQANRRANHNEIVKDDKPAKGKTISSNHLETVSIFEDKFTEPSFKVYEDKLKKETSVALRESLKENDIANNKLICDNENKLTSICNDQPHVVLQDITQKITQQVVIESAKDKTKVDITQSEEFLNKSFTFDRSSLTDIRVRRESTKARSDLYDVDIYRADIYNYLRVAETQHRPKPGYMKKQPDITYSMRAILVDWLVEVAEEYRLHNETLYLAVSYIDRFLSYMSVVRAKLQLVGTAAMFIAAKYEEIYPPDVSEFVYITDDTYTKKQVLRMENLILRVLSFDLGTPTPMTFLTHYCTHNNLSDKIKYLAMYLCELSMLEADPYSKYLPSTLAASAIVLAQHTMLEEVWPHELELSSGYSLNELKECVTDLNKTFREAASMPQQAIQEKYKSNKYGHVSLLLPRNSDIYNCDDDSEA